MLLLSEEKFSSLLTPGHFWQLPKSASLQATLLQRFAGMLCMALSLLANFATLTQATAIPTTSLCSSGPCPLSIEGDSAVAEVRASGFAVAPRRSYPPAHQREHVAAVVLPSASRPGCNLQYHSSVRQAATWQSRSHGQVWRFPPLTEGWLLLPLSLKNCTMHAFTFDINWAVCCHSHPTDAGLSSLCISRGNMRSECRPVLHYLIQKIVDLQPKVMHQTALVCSSQVFCCPADILHRPHSQLQPAAARPHRIQTCTALHVSFISGRVNRQKYVWASRQRCLTASDNCGGTEDMSMASTCKQADKTLKREPTQLKSKLLS